jgi:putative DNA primase/helicase
MNIHEAVREWQLNGFSLIPIRVDGTKRPATRWTEFQAEPPSLAQVDEWWGNGHSFGVAVICGAVSGNLEMTEVEGRAFTYENITEIRNLLDEAGYSELWDYLNSGAGYVEQSPSGGIHFLYRVGDEDVPGNTKLADREATPDELTEDERTLLAKDPTKRFYRGLAETRGEGGYVIVAPTPGSCHPSGHSWRVVSGSIGTVPTISWEQRCALHLAVSTALGGLASQKTRLPVPADYPGPESASLPIPPVRLSDAGSLSPGDDFADRVDWDDDLLLGGLGWRVTSQRGHYREWCRAGKDPRQGMSATTGREGVDRLYVFSTSTNFPTEEPISKFHAYALIHHGGDHSLAARELRRRGFGEVSIDRELDDFHPRVDNDTSYPYNDHGNAMRLWDRVNERYRYVYEASAWYVYNGRNWEEDKGGSLIYETRILSEEVSHSDDPAEAKWGVKVGDRARGHAAVDQMKSTPGATISLAEFDRARGLLNVHNGVLNLRTGELRPHDPSLLMTQVFNAAYDPQATCSNFERFMEQVLPDADMRAYVQRALGYTLLGDADQRAMFLIYGPSGTGKSTLMETMRDVFGDYGQTAPSGTFKSRSSSDHGPTDDLHTLRGRRFVATSETAESTAFDEDLLKRLTGRDPVQSRALFEKNVEWQPQMVLWLATNNPPRLSSDDDAIWRRLKMIPFMTQFLGDDEVFDIARKQLVHERNGILNWLLAGLREFLAHGLGEPEQVTEAAQEQRAATDSVARFLDDMIQDGTLIPQEGAQVRSRDLFAMYQDWARGMREHPVGSRRFTNRLLSTHTWLSNDKIGGQRVFTGLARSWTPEPPVAMKFAP